MCPILAAAVPEMDDHNRPMRLVRGSLANGLVNERASLGGQ